MEQTSAKRISSRSGSLHAVVTRLSAGPESLAKVAAAWLASDEAGRLVTTFKNVVRGTAKIPCGKKFAAGAAKDPGKLEKQTVLLERDQKLNYLQLSRSFKISGMVERLDDILQFL